MKKRQDFREHDWRESKSAMMTTKLRLCRDLLKRVITIHAQSWMHRDITSQNLLLIDANLKQSQFMRVVLCDFEKLYFQKIDTFTALTAWDYLLSKIMQDRSNEYNQSINVKMLTLALFLSWYSAIFSDISRHFNQQFKVSDIKWIHDQLAKRKESNLSKLLREMLNVNSRERSIAEQTLKSSYFRNLNEESVKLTKIIAIKLKLSRMTEI